VALAEGGDNMLRTPTSLPSTMPPAEAYLIGWGDCEAERDSAELRGDTTSVREGRLQELLKRIESIAPWPVDPAPFNQVSP